MEPKEPQDLPNGEFHHFQLVNGTGEVPLSISLLVHYNRTTGQFTPADTPISAEDVIEFHDALKSFDGNFINAISHQK